MKKNLSIFLLLISSLAFGQVHKVVSYGLIKECHVFYPDTVNTYPAILWLHGLNSAWDNDPGIGQQMKNGLHKNFVVYCPNNPDQADWSKNEIAALKHIIDLGHHPYKIVTGYSQGGIGSVSCINFDTAYWFASGIVAGKTGLTNYYRYTKIHIKAWHSVDDPRVGNSIYNFIKGVSAAGGDCSMEVYPIATHDYCAWAFDPGYAKGFWPWIESYSVLNVDPLPNPDPVTKTEIINNEVVFTTASGKKFKIAVSTN